MFKSVVTILIGATLMFAAPTFAVDGIVLINQSTVTAQGGFPYKITQPGSYKLSGNLVVPAGVDGIDILTDNATIDLNGFRITGPNTCTGTGASVSCSALSFGTGINGGSLTNGTVTWASVVTVRNGSIGGFGNGVNLQGLDILVQELHVNNNAEFGLVVANAIVRRNTVFRNLYGINAQNSTVIENVVVDNQQTGLIAGQYVLFGSNVFTYNGTPFATEGSNVSQDNNLCNGTIC